MNENLNFSEKAKLGEKKLTICQTSVICLRYYFPGNVIPLYKPVTHYGEKYNINRLIVFLISLNHIKPIVQCTMH